jgi:uncharacterized membrane protein YecN with MAPEG domain
VEPIGAALDYAPVAVVTLLALLTYFAMAVGVARARVKAGIPAPAMTGDARLERTIRAHVNTLEWLPIFLPALWLFAAYWSIAAAAVIGAVWIVGRIIYFAGYVSAVRRRAPGFLIQTLACTALILGALGRILYLAVTGG